MEHEKFEMLAQRLEPGSRLVRSWELKGGVSAQVTAIELVRADGLSRKMVVRQHGAADLRKNSNIAADEFKLLQILHSVGLAAPQPYYCDQSGTLFATPYIVIEYIEGTTEFTPTNRDDFLQQLAVYLSRVHQLDSTQADLAFLPRQETIFAAKFSARPARLDDSIEEGSIRTVLEAAWPLPQRNKTVLLHGDFWPGNVVWQDGQIAAVLDWEDAHLGDPLEDLGITRLDMLWSLGLDAMRDFTERYRAATELDCANLPYWDLCAALRPAFKIGEWAADASAEQVMREKHRLFVTQALDKIADLSDDFHGKENKADDISRHAPG